MDSYPTLAFKPDSYKPLGQFKHRRVELHMPLLASTDDWKARYSLLISHKTLGI